MEKIRYPSNNPGPMTNRLGFVGPTVQMIVTVCRMIPEGGGRGWKVGSHAKPPAPKFLLKPAERGENRMYTE